MSASSAAFTAMINQTPDLLKFYEYKSDNMETMKKLIASPIFGGSAFLPVGTKGLKVRIKKNNLQQQVAKLITETVFNGGYYVLPNIRNSKDDKKCMDIYLLTPSIKNQDLARKIQVINDQYQVSVDALKDMEKAASQKSPKKGGEKLVRESIKTKTVNKAVYLE